MGLLGSSEGWRCGCLLGRVLCWSLGRLLGRLGRLDRSLRRLCAHPLAHSLACSLARFLAGVLAHCLVGSPACSLVGWLGLSSARLLRVVSLARLLLVAIARGRAIGSLVSLGRLIGWLAGRLGRWAGKGSEQTAGG